MTFTLPPTHSAKHQCLSSVAKRKTSARREHFAFSPQADNQAGRSILVSQQAKFIARSILIKQAETR